MKATALLRALTRADDREAQRLVFLGWPGQDEPSEEGDDIDGAATAADGSSAAASGGSGTLRRLPNGGSEPRRGGAGGGNGSRASVTGSADVVDSEAADVVPSLGRRSAAGEGGDGGRHRTSGGGGEGDAAGRTSGSGAAGGGSGGGGGVAPYDYGEPLLGAADMTARPPRAVTDVMTEVAQSRQLGYVTVTRPVRQGRLKLAMEEVLMMALDPPGAPGPQGQEGYWSDEEGQGQGRGRERHVADRAAQADRSNSAAVAAAWVTAVSEQRDREKADAARQEQQEAEARAGAHGDRPAEPASPFAASNAPPAAAAAAAGGGAGGTSSGSMARVATGSYRPAAAASQQQPTRSSRHARVSGHVSSLPSVPSSGAPAQIASLRAFGLPDLYTETTCRSAAASASSRDPSVAHHPVNTHQHHPSPGSSTYNHQPPRSTSLKPAMATKFGSTPNLMELASLANARASAGGTSPVPLATRLSIGGLPGPLAALRVKSVQPAAVGTAAGGGNRAAAAGGDAGEASAAQVRILLAEDNAINMKVALGILKRTLPAAEVVTAENGVEVRGRVVGDAVRDAGVMPKVYGNKQNRIG